MATSAAWWGGGRRTRARARGSLVSRAWSAILATWGAFVGLLPHVLHHVGPLAGAALLAGAGGRLLFAGIGFVAAVPFLRRLRRRFQSWVAPGIALVVMAVAFSVSTFAIGPLIAGGDEEPATPTPAVPMPATPTPATPTPAAPTAELPEGHDDHH